MTLETIGWIGSIAFAICGAPQAYQSWKDGHTRGLNWPFLATWTIGEVCMLIYVFPKGDWPLFLNYLGNGLCLAVMLKYKIWERRAAKSLSFNFTPRML